MIKKIISFFKDPTVYIETRSVCRECEAIFRTNQTMYNFFSFRDLHLLKEHKHFEEYHGGGLKRKEIIKLYFKIISYTIFTWLFFIIGGSLTAIVHGITFPFWWIHEKTYW